MGRQDGKKLCLADKWKRVDLKESHDHPLDHYEEIINKSHHNKTQGEFLHGRQGFGFE